MSMTAAQYLNTITYAVLRYAGHGAPAGQDLALLLDDQGAPYFDLPIHPTGDRDRAFHDLLDDLVGTVRDDGSWEWDGNADLRDCNNNSVLAIWIRSDRDAYETERQEFEASV